MTYFATITNTFNQNIFNKVFDYSFIVANEYLEKTKYAQRTQSQLDNKKLWEKIYKEEFDLQKDKSGCFIEIYEKHNDVVAVPVGYAVGRKEDQKFITNTFLSGRRAASNSPLVVDPQLWDDLMSFIKAHGCDEYVCETDQGGTVWKALKIISRSLRYPVNFKIGNPYSTMSMKWVPL